MDLDNFKNINDSFGHTIGDKLLIEIANRIKKCTKESDIVARLGGDEFLILITNVYEKQSVESYLNNMLEELRNSIVINGINIITSASFGAALYSKDGDSFEELFKNADTAMYKAKESGKRNYVFFEQWMNDDIVEMVIMEDNLRTALENNEFILHYQPKYNPYDSRIDGFEALIRWNNPNLGLVSPFKFIGIAEKTGLIIPIGRWVLENACYFIKSLHNKGEKNISVAVNVSVIQLVQKDFIDMVNDIIKRSGVDPRYINIEITESILMESIETNISKINELKKIGVKISLDDFGKGYSSLTYLKDIPFDTLKIDKLFVDELCNEKDDNAIVGTIIKLAHQMNLEVVAEGVESEEQYRYLINNNCDLIQGYYISKPIPIEEIEDVLKKYNK
ncbi:Cyclic di-GMP phosphodiesterase Gmr [compost metagenome]